MRAVVILLAILLLGTAAFAQEGNEPEPTDKDKARKCYISGLPWLESSTRVRAVFSLDGEAMRGHFATLPYMMMAIKLFADEGFKVETLQVEILDYTTFGTEHETMINVEDTAVWFLLTDSALPGSAASYIAAFTDKEVADEYKEKLGGEVLTFGKVTDRIASAFQTDPGDDPGYVDGYEDQ